MNGRLAATPASRTARRRATPVRAAVVLLALLLPPVTAACVTVSRQDEIAMGREYARQLDEELRTRKEETEG